MLSGFVGSPINNRMTLLTTVQILDTAAMVMGDASTALEQIFVAVMHAAIPATTKANLFSFIAELCKIPTKNPTSAAASKGTQVLKITASTKVRSGCAPRIPILLLIAMSNAEATISHSAITTPFPITSKAPLPLGSY